MYNRICRSRDGKILCDGKSKESGGEDDEFLRPYVFDICNTVHSGVRVFLEHRRARHMVAVTTSPYAKAPSLQWAFFIC